VGKKKNITLKGHREWDGGEKPRCAHQRTIKTEAIREKTYDIIIPSANQTEMHIYNHWKSDRVRKTRGQGLYQLLFITTQPGGHGCQ